jgi:hypothetical protein
MAKAVILASFLRAVLAGPDDYFAIDGASPLRVTDSSNFVSTCNVPDLVSPNRHYHPEVPMFPNGPLPDFKVEVNIFGASLPESTLLQIADANSADFALKGLVPCDPTTGATTQGLEWLPRTNASVSKRTTYLHKTRCADGAHGQQVKTSSSVYKKCPGDRADLQVVLTFRLPPSLCQQTCDKKSDCEAYTVDAIGQNCWILNGELQGTDNNYLVYWRVGRPDTPQHMHAASLQKAPTTLNVSTRALEAMAQNTASSNNYFAIDGAHFEEIYADFLGTCNVPSTYNRSGLPVFPYGPLMDLRVGMNLNGANIPESTMLQYADLNSADMALTGLVPCDPTTGGTSQGLEWLPRTNASVSKRTTYLHKTRCAGGTKGQQVKTASSIYKKCPNGEHPILNVALTFQLPPSLCQHTCDKKSDCEAYTVDEIGQNCWILTGTNDGANYGLYWRVG